jgi:hypothetical protein
MSNIHTMWWVKFIVYFIVIIIIILLLYVTCGSCKMRVASSVRVGVLVQVFLQDIVLGRDVILFWSCIIKYI